MGSRTLEYASHARRLGTGVMLKSAADTLWGAKRFLGLRADLAELPQVKPAKVAVAMEPRDVRSFRGFDEELRQTSGTDHAQVLFRTWLAAAGVQELYAAVDDAGAPVYVQWLVRHRDQHLLRDEAPNRHPELRPDEVLLEGAYTFVAFRRMGVMADGMSQLLHTAAAEGARTAFTYVEPDNIGSMRGCASAGFVLDHVRVNSRRLGRTVSTVRPADATETDSWQGAVGPAA